MKNRKGFTLVEVIVVIGLLAIFSVAIGISLNRNMKKNQENKIKEFNQKIVGAANLYASNSQMILESLYEDKGFILISTNDLINAGLIQENIIDPNTNEKITGEESVKISLDSMGTIKIEYPVVNTRGDYLQVRTIIIPFGTVVDNVCYSDLNQEGLRYIKSDGNADLGYLKKDENITCSGSNSINFTKLGTYELRYDYTLRDGSHKQAIRNVIIEDKVPPVCGTVTPSINNNWVNTPREISITCSDNYRCEQERYTKTISNVGVGTIKIKDVANNSVDCNVNVYSDTTVPTNVSISASTTAWAKEVTLTGKGTDGVSGIKYYRFSTEENLTDISTNGTPITPTTSEITKTLKVTDEGIYTYYFYVQDQAGNIKRSDGVTVKIDTTKPNVPTSEIRYDSSTGTVRTNANTWTNQTLWWGKMVVGQIKHYGGVIIMLQILEAVE